MKFFALSVFILLFQTVVAQPFAEYQSFSGQYDFVLIGNTLNEMENNSTNCTILSASTATLDLSPDQVIEAAYLYWSGSGTGDFDVSLNGGSISATRSFSLDVNGLEYFAAFEDVTAIVQGLSTNQITISDLDLDITNHCANATNYGGWSLVVVYEDPSLPVNDIRVNDGFVGVSAVNPMVSITLDEPVIYDVTTATIGFLAWEGDSMIANGENLSINGSIISNPPLNPADNLFNGTNSFTGDTDLYNMDLDFFDISGLINETDDFLEIEMNTLQDLIIMNVIVTKVEDATATDTDDDLVFDAEEDINGNRILLDDDTDADTIPNYLDDDDDGDGTLTRDEDYNNNGTPTDDDTNGNNIPDYLDDQVFLGVNEFEINKISLVPNPVNDNIFIDVSTSIIDNYFVKVVSISGKTIIDFGAIKIENGMSLDVASLQQGLYFLTFQNGTGTSAKRFLKL